VEMKGVPIRNKGKVTLKIRAFAFTKPLPSHLIVSAQYFASPA